MLRRGLALPSWLIATTLLFVRVACAQAAPTTAPHLPAIGGVYLLATAGYGDNTQDIRGMNLAPYSAGFGLNAGFTFEFGLHLGAYFDYSLGRTTAQHYDALVGRPLDYDADTSSWSSGVRFAFDVPLHLLVLRYSVGVGVTSMTWDFGDVDASDVLYGDASNPSVGIHFAPGLALLWPHDRFVAGVGFDYLAQVNVTLPSGFLGRLFLGVKL